MYSSRMRSLQWPSGWVSSGWVCVQGVSRVCVCVCPGGVCVKGECPPGKCVSGVCVSKGVYPSMQWGRPPVDRILLRTVMMCLSFRRMILLVLRCSLSSGMQNLVLTA